MLRKMADQAVGLAEATGVRPDRACLARTKGRRQNFPKTPAVYLGDLGSTGIVHPQFDDGGSDGTLLGDTAPDFEADTTGSG